MKTLDNYRSSLDYREILRILQRSTTLQENFLWQSHALGKNVVPIHHFEIDFVAREVVVYVDTQRYRIDKELPLYVKLDYRTSVFKMTQYREGTSTIHFPFPQEIKTLELRAFPRHQFLPNEDKIVTLRPSVTGTREATELHVRAIDISRYGLGLLVSEQNRSFLKNNRILWVTGLGNEKLQHPILAEVAYISNEVDAKFQIRKQKDLKVGLKLSGVFPNDSFQHFIQ